MLYSFRYKGTKKTWIIQIKTPKKYRNHLLYVWQHILDVSYCIYAQKAVPLHPFSQNAYNSLNFGSTNSLIFLLIFSLIFVFMIHKTLRKCVFFGTFRRVSRYVELNWVIWKILVTYTNIAFFLPNTCAYQRKSVPLQRKLVPKSVKKHDKLVPKSVI